MAPFQELSNFFVPKYWQELLVREDKLEFWLLHHKKEVNIAWKELYCSIWCYFF